MKPALAALLALAACGDGAASPIDGVGNPDASGPHARVVLHDDYYGEPIERARIAVESPRGLVELFLTDAEGEASFRLDPGSRVWIADTARVFLLESISPGDVIELGASLHSGVLGGETDTLVLTFDPIPNAGTTHYWIDPMDSCGNGSSSTNVGRIEFIFPHGCVREPRDAVIGAFEGGTSTMLGYLHVPDAAPVPGARTLDGAFEPERTYDVTVTGLTPDPNAMQLIAMLYSPAAWYAPYAYEFITDGAVTAVVRGPTMPPPYGVRLGLGSQAMFDTVDTLPTSYHVDAPALLPYVSAPTLDDASNSLGWTATAAPLAPQLVTARINTYDSLTSRDLEWVVYAPGDRTSLVIPPPPAQLELNSPPPNQGILRSARVWLVQVDGASYPELLRDIDRHQQQPWTGVEWALDFRPTDRHVVSWTW